MAKKDKKAKQTEQAPVVEETQAHVEETHASNGTVEAASGGEASGGEAESSRKAKHRELPPFGTIIEKKSRDGAVIGTLEIVDVGNGKAGFRMPAVTGPIFPTLSSAAMVHAVQHPKEDGTPRQVNRGFNGWLYWNLIESDGDGDGTERVARSVKVATLADLLTDQHNLNARRAKVQALVEEAEAQLTKRRERIGTIESTLASVASEIEKRIAAGESAPDWQPPPPKPEKAPKASEAAAE